MQDNEKKPALRFKGFTDPWEQRKLGELGTLKNGMNFSKAAMGIGYPFVNLQNIFGKNVVDISALGKAMASLGQLKDYSLLKGDVLFVRSSVKLEGVGEAALVPESLDKTTYSGFIIRFRDEEGIDNNYKRFVFATEQVRNQIISQATDSANKNISQSVLADLDVPLPELEEQSKIGQYFSDLDTLITLHQRKYEKLVNIKKSMLDKMFPQNGASVPEIRFKGFTDPWEQRKFGEVVDKYEDPVETPHDGYYRLGIRSHAKGTFHSYVEKGHELETAQMYRVAAGNFIVNITFGWEHAVAITNESDAGKLVSHRFPQYSFHDDMLPEFFKYVIADEDFRHWLWLASPGGAGRNRVLKLDEMLNYEMVLPSKEEQQRIAAIFRNLDTLITLHQRKLEKLQNIKKSCLEKMFV